MASSEEKKDSSPPPGPPPASALFLVYSVLGAILSFSFGRDPGTLPSMDDLANEMAPTICVICLFLVSYSLVDVMEVGIAKMKHKIFAKPYSSSMNTDIPEEVYLAQRAHMNQVEQMPGFLIGSISFSLFVNGKVGAVLSLIWVILRRLYASTYRAAIGKPLGQAGIAKYTIPCYFLLNALLMGTVVHCIRFMISV